MCNRNQRPRKCCPSPCRAPPCCAPPCCPPRCCFPVCPEPACCSPPCCGLPSPCIFPRVCYLIFDLESAVFDPRNIYQRACRDVVATYRKRKVPDAIFLQSSPMETQELAELVCRKLRLNVPWEQFLIEMNARAFELITTPPFMPGVERLVNHLYDCCKEMALVANCSKELYEVKIRGREPFFEHFSHVLCSDDPQLNQVKPEPDVYLIAMSRFCGGPSAEDCLVFDGTQKGVAAARDARMQVVMLPEESLPCCWSEKCTLRLESLEEFKPEQFGMPSYDCCEQNQNPKQQSSRRRRN